MVLAALGLTGAGLTRPASPAVPVLVPTLRSLAAADGISFGAAVDVSALLGDPGYATQLGAQYDMVTPENVMKWMYTEPRPGVYDFRAADALVGFARAHGMKVRGHNLVWFEQNPVWLTRPTMTPGALAGALRRHITAEVGHFRGRISQWDVVNEAVDDDGALRRDVWSSALGSTYIAEAFRWAHAADPGAVLFYNDYGIDKPGPKADAVLALLTRLRREGSPVGGVGFELHLGSPADFDAGALAGMMARFAAVGLATAVTEMDVRLKPPAPAGALDAQAVDFAGALQDCRAQPSCHTFVSWGYTDLDSWIPGTFPGFGQALPFDAGLRPKPAAYALQSGLAGPRPRPPTGAARR